MVGDISPMSPVSSTPMVREKRHYPGEHKEQDPKQQKQDESSDDDKPSEKKSEDDGQQKPVNSNEKNVKVGHIDEYA